MTAVDGWKQIGTLKLPQLAGEAVTDVLQGLLDRLLDGLACRVCGNPVRAGVVVFDLPDLTIDVYCSGECYR